MNVYLRKLFPHDITHEVSVAKKIIKLYFNNQTKDLRFVRKGCVNGRVYDVIINDATDPRFGGEFKEIFKEDLAKQGDILIIIKREDGCYELSVAFEGTLIHDRIKGVFEGTERHAIVDILLLGNY